MKRCDDMREELLPGLALGVLDREEQGEAATHVDDCPDCRKETEQMAEALHTTLGQSVPPASPSPLVRTQFLARLALEMGPDLGHAVPARPSPPTPALLIQGRSHGAAMPLRQAPLPRWLMGVAAVPAAVALALGIAVVNMKGQLDDQRNHALYTAFVDTPHVAMPLQGQAVAYGMKGEVIMPTRGTSGLVIVSGVPADTTGKTFTCWLHSGGRWTASGDLRPDASGIAMVVLNRNLNLHSADRVAISMERTGPSPAAPSQPMLSVAL